MKKVIVLVMTIVLFIACQEKEQRYFSESSEINTLKAGIASYEAGDWTTWKSHFADTAKIYVNSEKSISVDARVTGLGEMSSAFSKYGFDHDDEFIEMVLDKENETWVYYWAQHNATIAANNKRISIPVHLSVQFIDGKIVEEHIFFDATEMNNEMEALAEMNNLPPEENRAVVNSMYQSFSKGDIPEVLASLDPNVVWMEAEGNAYADGNPYKGPDAVLKGIFTRIGDEYESFSLENIELHEMANDKVLATLRYNGKLKANGATIDAQAAHLWTLRDGKVIDFQQYVDTKQLADAMGK